MAATRSFVGMCNPFSRNGVAADQRPEAISGVTVLPDAASDRRHPYGYAEIARSAPLAAPYARGRRGKPHVRRDPVGFWSEECPIA